MVVSIELKRNFADFYGRDEEDDERAMGQIFEGVDGGGALWFKMTKNWDVNTGPLARPFALSHCSRIHLLCTACIAHAPLRSLVHSLTHSRGKLSDLMS